MDGSKLDATVALPGKVYAAYRLDFVSSPACGSTHSVHLAIVFNLRLPVGALNGQVFAQPIRTSEACIVPSNALFLPNRNMLLFFVPKRNKCLLEA